MRVTSQSWRDLIAYTHPMVTRIDSYLDGSVLATRIPLTTGRIQYDDSGVIKRRLTFSVPAQDGLDSWDPAGKPTHPLAMWGQRLSVRTGIGYPNGATEYMDHGWYLIIGWSRNEAEGNIDVEAVDLSQLLVDDRLTKPSAPAAGATFFAEFTRLVAGIVPVVLDPGLTDKAIAATTLVWDRDRDRALTDLCDAWPARWYIGDDGSAHVAAPYPLPTGASTPDLILTDGTAGTIVARARGGERGAVYNVMVVDGKPADDGTAGPHAESAITDPASPIRADGPYGRVTRFYASDLITTTPQAQASADTLLGTYSTAGRVESVTAIPDPSIQLGDVARVYTLDGGRFTGRVITMDVPLTPDGAPMSIGVAMVPGYVSDPGVTIEGV